MTTPLTRLALALLGTAAVLAGCTGESATVTDRDAILRLKLDEFRIVPQNIRVVATSVPMRVRIIATNVGRLIHTVKLERIVQSVQPDDTGVPPAPTIIAGSPVGNAAPGETIRSDDIYLQPGRYRLADTVGNHENLGQYGTLTIQPPAR